ncbi:superoxide dismutase[Cu-Zn] [Sphingomonas abietis]|uniref:Superoxide dismutase [Cu-Zn] n=1 Tax=Sphingomonas abietis TaxID=3012344 RepID=A0ABY7NNT8_9SPHN|nr:superoxide dismutase family protein [Sphingomonas abietis]WBO22485.1 superoxide dismutase family protein [Sphingomonas abietis]
MRILPVFAGLLLAGTAIAQDPIAAPQTVKTSELKNGAGAVIGHVTLTDAPHGVLLRVEASGLTPGWHGIHFHEKGDCSDAAFKMSGGHVHTMTPSIHGLLNPQASDQGDLPNIFAGADGTATAELFTPLVALHAGTARADLLDADGSAVVIHAAADDYKTQPIGGAGARVACAVVK